MKVTVSTERIKEAVAKSIKGAGNNNLIPLTSMIGIKKQGSNLYFLTTDGRNTLKVIIDKVTGDDFNITLSIDVFSKLITKTTSESVTLNVDTENSVLKVIGNGSYSIPIIYDEEGRVSFPDPESELEKDSGVVDGIINKTSVMSVYNVNRNSLAKTMENPFLTGYYMGERVISTDTNVICFNDFNVFGTPLLISSQMLNLLTLNTAEKISYTKDNDKLIFRTDDIVIIGSELEGKSDYPVSDIEAYLEESFPSVCKLPKAYLLSVLDRLSLFIEPYDKNGANFTFTQDGVEISSRKSSSIEKINYVNSENFKPFSCCVDIPMFKEQITAIPEDTIELHYGNEAAFKITSGKIVIIISLLEDEING